MARPRSRVRRDRSGVQDPLVDELGRQLFGLQLRALPAAQTAVLLDLVILEQDFRAREEAASLGRPNIIYHHEVSISY